MNIHACSARGDDQVGAGVAKLARPLAEHEFRIQQYAHAKVVHATHFKACALGLEPGFFVDSGASAGAPPAPGWRSA
jgi:hypothetical protein